MAVKEKSKKELQEYLTNRYKKQNDRIREEYDRISVTLPKGTKDRIKAQGFTVNGYINELVLADLERLERKNSPTDDELPECFR